MSQNHLDAIREINLQTVQKNPGPKECSDNQKNKDAKRAEKSKSIKRISPTKALRNALKMWRLARGLDIPSDLEKSSEDEDEPPDK